MAARIRDVMPETDLTVAGMVASACAARSPAETFAVNKRAPSGSTSRFNRLATLDHKGEPVADVLKARRHALYQAKHDGRNRVVSTRREPPLAANSLFITAKAGDPVRRGFPALSLRPLDTGHPPSRVTTVLRDKSRRRAHPFAFCFTPNTPAA